MKPRKVVIMIEAKSDMPLEMIKQYAKNDWNDFSEREMYMEIHQITVQVVKQDK